MTKKEAISALKNGKRLWHRSFDLDEYITQYSDTLYQDYVGFVFPQSEFWSTRIGPEFETGWKIVNY